MGYDIGKAKTDDANLPFQEKNGTKNPPGKGSILAIDISKPQRFTTAVVMNKTEAELIGTH